MTGVVTKWALGVAMAGLLAACSSESSTRTESVPRLIFGAAKDVVSTRREGRAPKTVVTPKMLAETKVAALQVNPEQRGGSDFLRRLVRRNDGTLGTVEVWAASDNAQLILRNGVVVGSRGVGGDIISSDATATISALRARATTAGQRRFVLSDGDVTTTEYRFECRFSNMGAQTIEVVNRRFSTTRMRETCVDPASGTEVFENDYWVEAGTSDIRRSRQWIGNNNGFFEIILLKK